MQKFGKQLDTDNDEINLVESQPNDKDNNKNAATGVWQTFGNIIDRALFAVLTVLYIYWMLKFLPESWFDEIDNDTIEIVNEWFRKLSTEIDLLMYILRVYQIKYIKWPNIHNSLLLIFYILIRSRKYGIPIGSIFPYEMSQ